jgi:hypothetical protein
MLLITTLVVTFLLCCVLEVRCGQAEVVSGLQAKAEQAVVLGRHSSLTAPNLQHTAKQERNDQRGNQQHSRELLMMDIVMPETCSACKKYNKIISGIWLVFYSSVITMMHGPINIRFISRRCLLGSTPTPLLFRSYA